MHDQKLVSIILPAFNAEKYIAEAIDSILNQTYIGWELIIIYDKSSDHSLDIIKDYINKDSRISLVYNPAKGLISALNHGIKISKGDFIARMDADDISMSDRIELQIKHMILNNLDICGCHHQIINDKGDLGKVIYNPLSHEHCFIRLLSAVPFAHPSVVIRKDFIIKNNLRYGINTNMLAEDLDMWINMFNAGAKFGNINQIKLRYRILNSSLSRKYPKLLMKESLILYNTFFNKNLKSISTILNKKIEFSNNNDRYYFLRMVIRYIIRKRKISKLNKLFYSNMSILFKASLVEMKNYILQISLNFNKKNK